MEVNNTRKLYDALKSDGYTDLGDFSSFEGKLKDSGKREMLYDVLKKDGWQDLGDFSQFESKLGYAPINNENIKETDYVSQSSVNPPPISLRQEVDIPKSDQSEYVNPWDNSADYNFESLRKKGKIETATPPPPTEYEKDSSFMNTWVGDAIQKLNAGGADLGAGIFGVLDKVSKGLESATGGLIPRGGAFKDISDRFKADAEFSRARSNRYNGKDFTDLWKEGNYMGAIGDIALQGVESLPMSIGAMAATMAGAPAAGLAGIGSIVASQKYDDLDQNNPNMGEFAKVSNAILTGTAESLSEMLGAGVSKAWMSTLFKTLGKEKAQEAIKRGIMGKMQEFYKKFGMFFEPVNEGIEEVSSTLAENITDKITGADPERDLTDGVLQSFVYGMGGGAYFTGAGALAKGAQYVADKIGGKQAQQPITDSNVTDQGVETPPLLTKSRFAEAEEEGRNMTDPGDIRTASKKMEETRLSLSEMVPGLASTIESYVDDKASEAQVMSLLDGVNADARPLAEEFYADYLRISGLQDRIGDEIDNDVETYVANNITPYVTTNPDGQSIVTTATLSEGNVERPVYVRSIEGDKAVISDNGQDRMVSVKRLSDIVEQDVGHMRRTYEDQLLATRQSELDMTMNHNPKTQLPKPGLVIWNGDNAFILQEQDENGDWIAQPAALDKETGQVAPKAGSAPAMPITERDILALQDAMYDAQQADVSVSDQIEGDDMIDKAIENEILQSEGQSNMSENDSQKPVKSSEPKYPLTKDGKPDYKKMTAAQRFVYTSETVSPEEALSDLDADIRSAEEALNKIKGKISKATGAERMSLRDQIKAKESEIEEMRELLPNKDTEGQKMESLLKEEIKESDSLSEDDQENVIENIPQEKDEAVQSKGGETSILTREDGTPDFVSSGTDMTLDFLYDKYGDKMPRKIEVTRKSFDESLKKASDALEKAQEAYDDAPIGKEDKAEAALIKARQEYEAIKVEADFWANLDDDIKEASKKPGDVIAKEVSVMGDPMSGEELAAMMLANGSIKLTRDSYKKETGAGNNETARMFGLFASPEKGGVNIERAGEILELADRENGTNFFDENDTNAGRDAIIEVLSSAHTRGDLIDYVKRNREAIAERERLAEYNAYAEWCEENYHMSPEEYEAYEESMVRDFSEKQLTDEERGELDSQIADEIQAIIDEQNEIDAILAQNKPIENENIEGNDESGGDGLREGGGEVLPREQLDQTGGTGEVEGRESAGPDIDRTDGATQEGSSRGLVPFVAPSPKENETPLDYAERIVEAKRLFDEELKVNTNPSEAQKEAGNYKKGHVKINGFDVSIEQPVGSVRSGKDASGKEWSQVMNNTYGYIRGTESVDGDHIDVFLGPDMNSDMVYVVDQVNTDGSFDEHKVMMGFSSLEDARSAYLSNYEEGWQGLGNITGVALDEFKKWIDSSIRKTKPFSEYRSVDFIEEERPDSDVRFRSIGEKGAANLNKAETIESSINDWSNKLNTPVRVIHDVDDITDTDENMLARKRDSKGWYDTSTGEIVIVSPNSTSVGDAQRTFLHEVVGHHGLRELFGDDFDTFLDNVYRNANEDIRENIIDRTKGNPLNLREATEEYIAELAERGFDNKAERSLWEKIKDSFLDMLRKAGISLDFKLSDNDLRYILWRSYKNLEQGNLMDVAEDIVMRNRLSLNNINLNENGSIARDIEPEKGKQPSETKGTGRELETIDGVDENGNESERDHIDKPRGVENAIDGTENATDRNGKKTDGQVDNDGDQLDGGDTGDRNGSVRDGIDGERTVIGRAGSENKGRGVGESVREKTDDFSFAERIKKENDNIRLREAKSEVEDEEPLNKEMVDAWDKVASSDSFKFKEAMVDSLTAIDEFLKLLAKKTKSKILDYENPYYSLIALSSKNKVDMDSFDSKFLNPLNEAIRALIGDASEVSKKGLRRTWDWSKGALRDLVKYVQAKHGIERNRDMSVRDGIETLKAFDVDALSKMGVISESDLKNAKKTAENVAEEKGSEAYKKTYDKVLAKELKKGVDKEKAERSAEIAADYRKSLVKSEIYNKEMDKYKEKVTGTLIDRWEDSKKDILNKDLAWDEEQKELDQEALSFQWKLGDNSYGVILGKDYSGLSSVFKPSEDGANKDKWLSDAYDFVRDYESTHNMVLVDNLWDKVHNVSEYTLRRQYESGLISKSYMDKNLSRFKYFIPLRGFSDNIASDVYDYIDATEIKMGNPVKTAKGRISEADNPFAGLIHVGYGSITAGNRNLAKQRFLNLASNHDTGGLITIDNIWVRNVGTEENPEWVESIPQIPDNASGEEVAKAVKDHEEMMRELREEGKAELIKGGRSDIPYKTLYDQRSQHQVQVFVGGNRYVMTVNGNPRLAQAVNGLTNPDVKDDLAYVVARNLKTFMAGAFTSKNVAFSFANLIRDTPYANNSVFVTENFRYFKDFSGNQRRALFGLRSLGRNLYKYRRGEIDISDKEQAIFKEFMDNGGATGYTFVEMQKEYAKDLANKLEKLSDGNIGKLSPKELVSTVFECFEFMGNVAELVNRYAAYKTSREHGRSIDRSINDAKEVSVNFNKKGAGKKTKSDKWYINTAAWISEYGRDWVLFFNAAVQSMYKEYSMLRNHPIKGISSRIAPLIFMGSSVSLLNNLFMPMLFAYLGWDSDDDDRDYFDSLSDHERQNNICIRLTHGRWLKIPLSPELANYFKIGDIIAGQLSGKREVEAMDVVKTGIDMVSPLNINWEYDSWKFALNLLPTVVQPIAQNASNVNFMGNPIYKTSMNKANDYDPEYTKVYRSTSTTMVELSRALNSLTGGDDVKRGTSFNPATWQNILSGYTGGFGTVALGVSDLVLDMLSGENGDMPVSRYPLLSRFLTGGDKDLKLSRMNSIYNKKVVDFVSEMDHDYKGYLKKIQDTSVDDFDRAGYMVKLNQLTGSDDYRRSMVLSQYVKAISDMERFLREVGSDNDSLENQVYELKLQALEIFEDSDE